LRDLTEAGLIKKEKGRKKKNAEVYVLTARGESLRSVLAALYDWGAAHADSFGVAIGEPLARLD